MIRSMTAFATTRTTTDVGTLTLELRSVNNRYLDLHLRLPDELRFSEGHVREQLTAALQRGKVELRMSFQRAVSTQTPPLPTDLLEYVATQLATARAVIADVPAPTLHELLHLRQQEQGTDPEQWLPAINQGLAQALEELNHAKQREGQRLATDMLAIAQHMQQHIDTVECHLPELLAEHQQKITVRLTSALEAVSPDGFAQISGEELSARIAQEAALFAMRSDVAEEITRLRSHLDELTHLLTIGAPQKGSMGKRLDFLFQEMNREANTLGSKAGSMTVTQAAIDLKLAIEQLREQAQNIE